MKEKIQIIVVGTGFGGIYTLKGLQKYFSKRNNIEITIIGEKNYFLFTPLLHEVATGSINEENIVEPIRKIVENNLTKFILGKVKKINTTEKNVETESEKIYYDYLILAPGSETNFFNTSGAKEFSLTLKSIEDAKKIKNKIIENIEIASNIKDNGERKRKLSFTIIGGGPTGVELATEIDELTKENLSLFDKKIQKEISINIVQKNKDLVPQLSQKSRKKVLETLTKKNINLFLEREVKEITNTYVLLENGEKISSGLTIWTAGVKPIEIPFDINIEKDNTGRVFVNKYLQLQNFKNIFAIGDFACFINKEGKQLPQLAQVAEKEANCVSHNVYSLITDIPMKEFVYKHKGNMLSLGKWMAIAEISGFVFSGKLIWWLWKTIYLSKLTSFKKKIKVATDWTIHIFSHRDISKL